MKSISNAPNPGVSQYPALPRSYLSSENISRFGLLNGFGFSGVKLICIIGLPLFLYSHSIVGSFQACSHARDYRYFLVRFQAHQDFTSLSSYFGDSIVSGQIPGRMETKS